MITGLSNGHAQLAMEKLENDSNKLYSRIYMDRGSWSEEAWDVVQDA